MLLRKLGAGADGNPTGGNGDLVCSGAPVAVGLLLLLKGLLLAPKGEGTVVLGNLEVAAGGF